MNQELIRQLEEKYEKNPVLRGLMQIIPFGAGSALDVALTTRFDNMRKERIEVFFDELQNGRASISPEMIESVDFIHCYMITVRAAINTRRTEKIQVFSRLLKNSFQDGVTFDFDEYEELLTIIDDMSYREFLVLSILERYEREYLQNEGENELQRANKFWNLFTKELVEILNIEEDEIPSILTRLNRTGCYETITGGFFDYAGGQGKMTPMYQKLKARVVEQ